MMPLMAFLILTIPTDDLFGQSSHLTVEDTRDIVTAPNDYRRVLRPAFKRNTAIGLPTDGTYSTLLGLKGWSDDSGGPTHEIAFMTSKGIRYRSGTIAAGWSDWRRVLVENANGNVGIGTDTPTERLSVNGNIRAREIKVETNNWPDYVFHTGYDLRPLDELALFIKEHRHLPEIPSAAVIDQEGIQLGEMNKLLVKKVEELSLYILQLEERLSRVEESTRVE